MSLVHPIVAPQVALRATRGRFLGTSQECLAVLYSDRVEFKPLDFPGQVESDEDIIKPSILEITIPQPPMTLGDSERDILPNVGGLFFTVGRNRDMLVMQFESLLLVLSVNYVDQLLQLQGVWGLPKRQKDTNPRTTLVKAASAASFTTLMHEAGHLHHNHPHGSSSSSISSSISSGSTGSASLQGPPLSGMCLEASLPLPKPSPDGTQIFVASQHKSGALALLILDCFGKEMIIHDVDYISLLTLGWLSNDTVYFVYLNNKFHKKFQTCRLGSKFKQSGFLGIGGRKMLKNTFIPECQVTIASDFQASFPDLNGCEDLVFKDYVMLGTRNSGYIRVNFKGTGSWEPVQNAKNVLGTIQTDETALLIQRVVRNSLSRSSSYFGSGSTENSSVSNSGSGEVVSVTPTAANQLHYSVVIDGTVHTIRGDPQVGACLCSKHNIDGDRRYRIKLLSLGRDGYIIDYKRVPMRVYRISSQSTARIDVVPHKTDVVPLVTSKEASDFLVKTETALYSRDPNGDDVFISKIVIDAHATTLRLPLNRPGLAKLTRRDMKSLYAVFSYSAVGVSTPSGTHIVPAGAATSFPPEIRVLDESQKSATKMRVKAQFQFGSKHDILNTPRDHGNSAKNNFSRWFINRLYPVHKNVVIVGLSSIRVSSKLSWDEDLKLYKKILNSSENSTTPQTSTPEWALFLVSFVGATSKSKPVPPKAHLLMRGAFPEVAPQPMLFPSSPNLVYLQVYNFRTQSYSVIRRLTVNTACEFSLSTESRKVPFLPITLSQSQNVSFFTDDIKEHFENVYLVGQKIPPPPPTPGGSVPAVPVAAAAATAPELSGILSVDASEASSGFSLVIDGKTPAQTKIWVFDSNDVQFREFSYVEVPENRKQMLYRQEQILMNAINSSHDVALKKFKVNPLFRAQYYGQTGSAKRFRPLPELKAIICEGVGIGIDAEAYFKTPDEGYYAMFRIQNRKLLDSLNRLRKTILSERVGSWLPAEVKTRWLANQEQSTIIAGTLFAAYWRLDPEQQQELCDEAGVASNLMEKLRPS